MNKISNKINTFIKNRIIKMFTKEYELNGYPYDIALEKAKNKYHNLYEKYENKELSDSEKKIIGKI